jgi:hypothetical protein
MHRATPAQLDALDRLTGSVLFSNADYNHRFMPEGCVYISFKLAATRFRYLIHPAGEIEHLQSKTMEVRHGL